MEYNGRVYVYSTNDGTASSYVGESNNYGKINKINVISSSDMVNWTDHGSINVAGRDGVAKWAGNNWTFKDVTINISGLNGTKNLFFVASNDCAIDKWQFSNSGIAANLPSESVQPSNSNNETLKLSDGWYCIKNVNSGKYLQLEGNNAKNLSNVELRSGNKSEGQRWYLKNLPDEYITLTSALSEYMIDISSAEDKDGANVQIFNAFSGEAQQFKLKSSDVNGQYIISTKCSGLTKVLDDYQYKKAHGTNVCQWTYGGRENQKWIFQPIR